MDYAFNFTIKVKKSINNGLIQVQKPLVIGLGGYLCQNASHFII